MSELTPRSNPRLENFQQNKADAERVAFEKSLYDKAGAEDGTGEFDEKAERRVIEADEYERHLERMASPGYAPKSWGGKARGGVSAAEAWNPKTDLSAVPNLAHERDVAEAYELNAFRDAEAEKDEAKLRDTLTNTPELRRMSAMAQEIAALRSKPVTPESAERDANRIDELEDKLNDLLAEYSEGDDANTAVIDYIVDSTVSAPESRGKSDKKEAAPDEMIDKLTQIGADIHRNPRAAANLGVKDKLKEILEEAESPLDLDMGRIKDAKEAHGTANEKAKADVTPEEFETAHEEAFEINEDMRQREADQRDLAADQQLNRSLRDRLREGISSGYARMGDRYTRAIERVGSTDRKTRVGAFIGVVVVAALVGAAAWRYGMQDGIDGNSHASGDTPIPAPKPKTTGVDQLVSSVPTVEGIPDSARIAHPGEGWLSQLKQIGLSEGQAREVLPKLFDDPALAERVYVMPNGDPGILGAGVFTPEQLTAMLKYKR